jgi:hypothetical protein
MGLNEKFFNSASADCQPDQNELVFHIDAADSNSINAAGTGTWQDLSGNSRHFGYVRATLLSEGSLQFTTANVYGHNFSNMVNSYGMGTGNYNWSIAMWVNPAHTSAGFASLYEQGGYSDGSANGYGIYRSGSSLQMYARGAELTARQLVNVANFFGGNTWVHIVVQRTDVVWEVYKNGVLQTNSGTYKSNSNYLTDDLGTADATDSNTIIGRQYAANVQQWEGRMSDIKLYDMALTQCEVEYEFDIKQFDT